MDSWSKALRNLHPDDKKYFTASQSDPRSVLAGILKEARAKRTKAHQKRWKFTKSNGSVIILRDVFENIMQSVSRYTQVVDVAVSTAPMYAAPPWTVVRFLLQTSTVDLRAFGCMSEGIEEVATAMARYEVIETLYILPTAPSYSRESQLLSDCVINVYTIILNYLAKAKEFWSNNTAKRMASTLFTNMEVEHNEMQSALRKADDETCRVIELSRDQINLIRDQQRMQESKATRELLDRLHQKTMLPVVRIARDISNINDKLDRNERSEILRWLSTVPCETQHQDAVQKIVEGTGGWLLDRPELRDWQSSNVSGILWLHGIPGSGKSKLTSIVVESLLQQHRSNPTTSPPLAYFYCSKKGADVRSRNSREVLCALLRQLSVRNAQSPLRGSVALEYKRRKELSNETGAQVPPLKIDEAIKHLLDIAKNDPIVIVLDALDEVDEAERGDLFWSLKRLLQESQNVAKIFLSSRTDGDIVESFEQYPNIGIEESMNGEDIKNFVVHKIQEAIETKRLLRGKVSPSLQQEIIKALIGRAQGIWVKLSIETISNSKRMAVEKDVRSELGKLPTELKEQYKVIYEDILEAAPSTASIARKTFAWMLAAQRIFTVEEMIAAVALNEEGYYHTDLDVPRLLDICRNLIIVTSINNTSKQKAFQMAHLSVREFLEQLPEFSAEQIHLDAVSRLLDNFDSRLWLEEDILVQEKSMKILRDYTIYLFEHAEMSRLAKPECHLARRMKDFLFDDCYDSTSMLNQWYQIADETLERSLLPQGFLDISFYREHGRHKLYHSKGGALHLVCMHGLLSVLQVLDDDARVPWKAVSGFNELFVATAYGKSTVVKWLLERHIFHPDETPRHAPALFIAVQRHKSEEIVDLLLRYGANPLSRLEEGFSWTPWSRVFVGHNYDNFTRMFRSIELLQEKCPEKYSPPTFDWRLLGLIEALKGNWTRASLFLIQRGVNDRSMISRKIDSSLFEDEQHSTALQIAVKYSEAEVIESLLDRSAEHAAKSNKSANALPDVESKDYQGYVNYVDHNKRSALHWLMMRKSTNSKENEEIMRLLWKHGADPKVISGEGHTALHVAATIGSTCMISLLIEKGLDLEAQVGGATALHIASGGNHREPQVIRYLTDKGMDPLGRDSGGRTPLHYAAAACNIPAIEALLEVLLGRDNSSLSEAKASSTAPIPSHSTCMANRPCEKLFGYVNLADDKGESLLHVAGMGVELNLAQDQFEHGEHVERKILDIRDAVRIIVDLGAKINQTAGSKTPLLSQLAAKSWSGSIAAKELLVKGADPSIPDSTGQFPLHYAAQSWRNAELIDDLLDAGANIEARDDHMRTPLHRASRNGIPEPVQSLLFRNADHEA